MEGLMSILGSAVWAELGLSWGVDDDIRTLRRRMSTINAVLGDAETRAINDRALRVWLMDLQEVAFDAEDVLGELQTEAALHEGKNDKALCCLCSYFSTLLFRNKMARKIKDIVKRFEEFAEERKKFHLAEGSTAVRREELEEFSRDSLRDEIVGRDDDKEKVVEWMAHDDDERDVSVLPIVGIAGLGKTTVARIAYNDERIVEKFENRMWVFVGEDFDLKAIAKAMLERVTGEPCAFSTLAGMYRLIRERITNKRYLLVLDNVWSENRLKWEKLKDMLRGSSHGNKVVVTTRSHVVAAMVGTAESAYKLGGLSDDACSIVFRRKAFERRIVPTNVVQIEEEVVRRCGGVPLAAKILGIVMATKTKHGEGQLLAFKDDAIWRSDQGAEGIISSFYKRYGR